MLIAETAMPRVLIITYYFPPAGGPGVQRIMGLVRHLPSFGWEPAVLTVEGGTFFNRDEESVSRVPPSVPVYRTKAFEPFALYNRLRGKPADEALPIGTVGQGGGGVATRVSRWVRANLFVPDARIGWIPFAVSAAKRIVKHERIDAILTSSPPQTVHLIGRKVARAAGLPWIADFRDPWTQIYYNAELPRCNAARRLDLRLEQGVVRSASELVMINEMVRESLGPAASRGHIIPNGYEEEDFAGELAPTTERFELVYSGNIIPLHAPGPFLEALASLRAADPEFRAAAKLVFVGTVHPAVREQIEHVGLAGVAEFTGFVPHAEAVRRLRTATVALFIGPANLLTSKIFEYLAAGRPMLALAPPGGDLDRLLRSVGREPVVPADDVGAIRAELERLFGLWKRNSLPVRAPMEGVEHLSRRSQTGQMARLLNRACGVSGNE